jgi:hypothetical protein
VKADVCAYCGRRAEKLTRDHVIPRNLYAPAYRAAANELITVPACLECNRMWCDDEAHFRYMLVLAGEPNEPVRELWDGKVRRSFDKKDGERRLRELLEQMIPVMLNGNERHMVYPGADPRVRRVLRKVIRGLCYWLDIMSPVPDEVVWVDALRFPVPQAISGGMASGEVVPRIFSYRYSVLEEPPFRSFWLLTFYEKRVFIGVVCTTREHASLLRATSAEHYRSVMEREG